jgi:3-hydroxyacyl-CoA dehydrogenase
LLEEGKFEGMVVGNQADHFCVGANIFVVLGEAMQQNWDAIDAAVQSVPAG